MPNAEPESAFESVDRLGAEEQAALLQRADGFIVPGFAGFLADCLEARHLLPDYARLSALLAITDQVRCDRLVRRFGEAVGEGDQAWINTVAEALLASI